jgi:hypothetical protein
MKFRRIDFGLRVFALVALLATGTTATTSAAVVFNERVPFAFTDVNPCAPQDGPIAFTGEEHVVVKEKPGGSLEVHMNQHGSGVSANGTRYVFNDNFKGKLDPGSPLSTRARVRTISQGPSDNFHVTVTFVFPPGTLTFEADCRG